MTIRSARPTRLLLLLTVWALPLVATAQTRQGLPSSDPLFRTIEALDREVFDAINSCALDKVGGYFTEDLEFYHDLGGLSRSRQSLVDATKNNLCGKVRRELVPGTLEVYPMKGGALEIGVHRFHHPGREKEDGVGEAKFIHLWQNKDGVWQITRIISFDHHEAEKPGASAGRQPEN
jgi:hypothetical protein